ncbi:MAG: ribonuclease J, partial [Cyanobacteria bacterium P01_A01_bin.135]
PSGIELMDAARTGVVQAQTLRDRQHLAEEGLITIAATVDGQRLVAQPEVHLRGVVTSVSKERMVNLAAKTIKSTFSSEKVTDEDSLAKLQSRAEMDLRRAFRRELRSNPFLVLLLQSVEPAKPAAVAS